jgi:hypothetical protein
MVFKIKMLISVNCKINYKFQMSLINGLIPDKINKNEIL